MTDAKLQAKRVSLNLSQQTKMTHCINNRGRGKGVRISQLSGRLSVISQLAISDGLDDSAGISFIGHIFGDFSAFG